MITKIGKVVGLVSVFTLLFVGSAAFCEAGDVIKIGGTMALSGPAAGDGQRFMAGRKIAIEMYNEQGGVLGKKLELVVRDDGMDPAKVGPLYETLIREEKLDFLVPPYGAPNTFAAMAAAEKYDKLMTSGYVSSTKLMEDYGGRRLFSTATQPKNKAFVNWWYRNLTDYFWKFDEWNYKPNFPKPIKVAVLSENQLWGIEQHKLWKAHAEKQGWEIVVDEFVEWGQMEFSAIVSKIKAAKPDLVLVEFFFFRCVPLLKQMREQGVKVPFVAMSEAATRADWTDPKTGAGSMGNGVITFALFANTYHEGGADDLRKRYQAKYGRQPGFMEATGYTDIQLIVEAVKMAGSTKTNDVRKALLNGTFKTAYTPAKFNSMGLNELFDPIIGQWLDNKLENIYPLNVQTRKPVYPFQ